MRGVTPTPARSHPENGGMAPHQFFENNYFSEANQLRVLTVHEGHMDYGALPSLKNRRFQLLLFFCYLKVALDGGTRPGDTLQIQPHFLSLMGEEQANAFRWRDTSPRATLSVVL